MEKDRDVGKTKIGQLVFILRPYKSYLYKSVITGLVLSIFSIPGPWFTKILIDRVYTTEDMHLMHMIVIFIFCISISQAAMQFLRDLFMANASMRMAGDIQMLFYYHLQKMSFKFYDSHQTGEVISRFSDISSTLGNTMGIINTLALNIVQIVVFPFVLFYVSSKLSLLALIILPFEVLIYLISNKYIQKLTLFVAEHNADLNATVLESLDGMKTIKSLGIESFNKVGIETKVFTVLNYQAKLAGVYHVAVFLQEIFKSTGTFLFLLFGWKYILNGEISLGSFLAFTSYIGFFYGPVLDLLRMNRQIEAAVAHTRRFLEIYNIEPEYDLPGSRKLKSIDGRIRFENVTFGYYRNNPVLRDINIEIPPRSVVALVGRSGAGKTTIANLITRFYEPSRGKVILDGRDISGIDPNYYRSLVGYVMQDPFLFNGTILDNITLGMTPSKIDIEGALSNSHVDEFLPRMPDGLNTMVGPKGMKMSQGQKQRIVMARVFLRKTPILVLDEPTSSLDMLSEEIIQKAIKNLSTDRTTIIIAHRLTTIKNADRILLVENGRITEQGNHRELLIKKGSYYEMYNRSMKL
jgi:ABC-type bacteriocin/lantibiotic exporter with double-glycine peptidase domain